MSISHRSSIILHIFVSTALLILFASIAYAAAPWYLRNVDPDFVAYGIEVKTWNATDDAPYFQIKGRKGGTDLECNKMRLDNKPENFEHGQTDYFIYTGQEIGDCGFPVSITFFEGGTDGWGFERVYIDYFIIPEPRAAWEKNAPTWYSQFKNYNSRDNIKRTLNNHTEGSFEKLSVTGGTKIKIQGKRGLDGDGDSDGGMKFEKEVTLNAIGGQEPKWTVSRSDYVAVPGSWRAIINAGGVAISESEQKLTMGERAYKEIGRGGSKTLTETLAMSTTVKAEADMAGVKASAETTVSSSLAGTVSDYFSSKDSTASERNSSKSNKLTCKVPPQPREYTIWAWTNVAKVKGEKVFNNTCLYACTKSSTIPPQFSLGEVENTCPGL